MAINSDKEPYFSVLLPTKNRAHLVGYAIQSVLDQTCDDFEIILVDNDDSDATSEAVKEFLDPRFKYFRTGGLNMSENWQYALEQAAGKYVTVLEDKQAYYPWALQRMLDSILKANAQVVIWKWDVFEDKMMRASREMHSGGSGAITSDHVLSVYTRNPADAWQMLPRMLNSCASREVIVNISSQPGVRRFFDELSPDLCAAFYLLAFVDNIYFLDDGLGLLGYMHESNALKMSSKKDSLAFYGGNNELLEQAVLYVPIKSRTLVHNTVYNDFLRIRGLVNGRLQAFQMSPVVYARHCFRHALRNIGRGLWNLNELKLIFGYCRTVGMAWWKPISMVIGECAKMLKRRLRRLLKRRELETWQANNIIDAVKVRAR